MQRRTMNDALGNVIVASIIALTFILPILYVLNPDPAESPLMATVIRGSLAALVILVVSLTGILARDYSSST